MFVIFRFQFLYRHGQLQVTNDFQSWLPRDAVVQIHFPTPFHLPAAQSMPSWTKPGPGSRWSQPRASDVFLPQLCYSPAVWPWPSHLTCLSLFLVIVTRPDLPHMDPGRHPTQRDSGKHQIRNLTTCPSWASSFMPFNSFTEIQFTFH